jgi:hypothetical protein
MTEAAPNFSDVPIHSQPRIPARTAVDDSASDPRFIIAHVHSLSLPFSHSRVSCACGLRPLGHGTLASNPAHVQRSYTSLGCACRDSRRLGELDPLFNCSSLPRPSTGHTASLSSVSDRRQLIIAGGLCPVYETSSAHMLGREGHHLRHSQQTGGQHETLTHASLSAER